MLTLHPHQTEAFNRYQEKRFIATLCDAIRQNHTNYEQVSPITLARIVNFGLMRANRYGFDWQSSLGQFIYLMAAIAPHFDSHPAIHALLINSAIHPEARIDYLLEHLPQGVWEEASLDAGNIGWFLTQDCFDLGRENRIALALSNALPESSFNRSDLSTQVKQAIAHAEALNFLTEDPQFVFAACRIHYGENFETQMDWAKETFTAEFTLKARVALLRVRIALDSGIWI